MVRYITIPWDVNLKWNFKRVIYTVCIWWCGPGIQYLKEWSKWYLLCSFHVLLSLRFHVFHSVFNGIGYFGQEYLELIGMKLIMVHFYFIARSVTYISVINNTKKILNWFIWFDEVVNKPEDRNIAWCNYRRIFVS